METNREFEKEAPSHAWYSTFFFWLGGGLIWRKKTHNKEMKTHKMKGYKYNRFFIWAR